MTESTDILRMQTVDDLETEALEMPEPEFCLTAEEVQAALEALLFAAGDPIPLDKLHQITGMDRNHLQQVLTEMAARYARDRQRGLMLREIEGNWLLCTKPSEGAILGRLFLPRHRPPLSQAAYETLAIIAYNQPVTRSQVEVVRGVNSDNVISRLLERSLVAESGTLDAPGRPTLFSTTEQFLLDFGLRSVKDLPPMEMLMYGTLRDFEQSLEEAAGRPHDKQLTIDQLVRDVVPVLPDETDPGNSGAPQDSNREEITDIKFLQLSGAIFGEDPQSGQESAAGTETSVTS
jgi:segregation and condensation protein B